MHTVFSISQCSYQLWQAELLAYSHRKVAQPGALTCLVATNGPAQEVRRGAFFTRTWSPHPTTGDDYAPYNKPYSVLAWLREAVALGEINVLLDPDCVFLHPLIVRAERGRPVAQRCFYMDSREHASALRRHWERLELVQPISIPLIIHRDDLSTIAPSWLRNTEELRDDPVTRERLGWTAEMWGYAIAAAALGLRHELEELTLFQSDRHTDRPILHYCYESQSSDKSWYWSKRTHRAWDVVPDPPVGTPEASIALMRLLNEYTNLRSDVGRSFAAQAEHALE